MLSSRSCAHDLAQRSRDPSLPPDHLADVVFGDVQPKHDDVIPLLALDPNGVGVVDKSPGERLQELLSQCSWS